MRVIFIQESVTCFSLLPRRSLYGQAKCSVLSNRCNTEGKSSKNCLVFVYVCFVLSLQNIHSIGFVDWLDNEFLYIIMRRVLKCAFAYDLGLTVLRWPCVVDRTLKSNCLLTCWKHTPIKVLVGLILLKRVLYNDQYIDADYWGGGGGGRGDL